MFIKVSLVDAVWAGSACMSANMYVKAGMHVQTGRMYRQGTSREAVYTTRHCPSHPQLITKCAPARVPARLVQRDLSFKFWENAERDFHELALYYSLPTIRYSSGAHGSGYRPVSGIKLLVTTRF
jgi:hypothetical protein